MFISNRLSFGQPKIPRRKLWTREDWMKATDERWCLLAPPSVQYEKKRSDPVRDEEMLKGKVKNAARQRSGLAFGRCYVIAHTAVRRMYLLAYGVWMLDIDNVVECPLDGNKWKTDGWSNLMTLVYYVLANCSCFLFSTSLNLANTFFLPLLNGLSSTNPAGLSKYEIRY